MTKRVYLAGPEVFLVNAGEIGARKRAICVRHGLIGVFPGDEEDACDPAQPPSEQGLAMRALGRPLFAYSNDGRSYLDRIAAFCGGDMRARRTGEYEGSRRHGDRAIRAARQSHACW